jgi:hypothetical protein
MPSSYISAEWVTDEVLGTRNIKAVGDDGSIWWVPDIQTDVPPWPSYLETEAGKLFVAQSLEPKGS